MTKVLTEGYIQQIVTLQTPQLRTEKPDFGDLNLILTERRTSSSFLITPRTF